MKSVCIWFFVVTVVVVVVLQAELDPLHHRYVYVSKMKLSMIKKKTTDKNGNEEQRKRKGMRWIEDEEKENDDEISDYISLYLRRREN